MLNEETVSLERSLISSVTKSVFVVKVESLVDVDVLKFLG